MTKGRIIIELPDGDPAVAEFDVTTDEQSVTIEITPTEVKIKTRTEPVVRHE